jgi:hypothetical protein
MARYIAPPDLHGVLEQSCQRLRKPRSTVLFRRGEELSACFSSSEAWLVWTSALTVQRRSPALVVRAHEWACPRLLPKATTV